jgi:hypothetical protein
MKRSLLALVAILGLARPGCTAFAAGDGTDDSLAADPNVGRLVAFAKNRGEDLVGDLRHASGKDKSALSRVFRFSLNFTELDINAKTYGEMIYSSFLGEAYTPRQYARMIAAEPDGVRQRIRDFLYYEMIHDDPDTVKEQEEKQGADWLILFPKNFSYGSNDRVFKNEASQARASGPP